MIETEVKNNDQEYVWMFVTDWNHRPTVGIQYEFWWAKKHKLLTINTCSRSRSAGTLFWKEINSNTLQCDTHEQALEFIDAWKISRGLTNLAC